MLSHYPDQDVLNFPGIGLSLFTEQCRNSVRRRHGAAVLLAAAARRFVIERHFALDDDDAG